jgi:hypothetical protein
MAKGKNEVPTSEGMDLDVVDEGRSTKDDPRPTTAPPPLPVEPSEKLGANFPLSPSDLPLRKDAKAFARKRPAEDGSTTVLQIAREDLDEKPRLGKTIVVCPYDKVFCEPAGSERGFTLFTCPVEGCEHTRKIVKPSLREILMRNHQQEDYSAR